MSTFVLIRKYSNNKFYDYITFEPKVKCHNDYI